MVEEIGKIDIQNSMSKVAEPEIETTQELLQKPVAEAKRGRGRPRKNPVSIDEQNEDKPKRGRGRPRKNLVPVKEETQEETDELIDLFNLDDEKLESNLENKSIEQDIDSISSDDETTKETFVEEEAIDLFGLDEGENFANDELQKTNKVENPINLFDLDVQDNSYKIEENSDDEIDLFNIVDEEYDNKYEPINNNTTAVADTQYKPVNSDFNTLLTKNKKVVSFVGTTKNGTSFIVNNAAHMLSTMGISTAILDITKTKNAYYIYTNSEEQLMKTAKDSIYKLRNGIADGVKINKNLTVYTSLPEDEGDYSDVEAILSTLVRNYSVVLIDCDFDTPMEYFEASQEIYLVQSMDVLTIQPLTAFLRNLQSRGILKQEKIKIVINKGVKIKSVPIKTLIGGISKYNDPSMTYMKDLFDKDKVNYCVIPFEVQNYIKYLDSLITCSINSTGYTKPFTMALKDLCNMIYPLINRQTYSPRGEKYQDNFSNQMNDTLNKMKRKYQ